MKKYFTSALLACLFIAAQSQFTKLFDFSGTADGSKPMGSLTLSGTALYGMTEQGGANNLGCIFKINIDGTGYSNLMDFSGTANGQGPRGCSLTLSGAELYGMTVSGGANNLGCIFKINIDGTGYTKLLDFSGTANGQNPYGSLTLSGTTLYGMTEHGGANNLGCIFKINTDGIGYIKLLDFSGAANGNNPRGSLSLSGTVLYGMTAGGGANNMGCVFKINTDGTGYIKLLDFSGITNGEYSCGSLSISGTVLYGMTKYGGANNMGCVFKINTDGTGYMKLLDFSGTANGKEPYGSLTLSGTVLYGMTYNGGAISNSGCVFQVNTDGSGYIKLKDFDGSNSGSYPMSDFLFAEKILYGTTFLGGVSNIGTIFKYGTTPNIQTLDISFPNIQATQVDISWTYGDGDKRTVFVKQGTGSITNPTNNNTYTASTDWSSKGTQLGTSGYYCVYNGTGNSVTLTNLLQNTIYTVQIFEYNFAVSKEQYNINTASNNPFSFTTLKSSQTITFGSLPDKNVGDVPFNLTATASSGLTVSYASSNLSVATVSGNTLTIVGAGTTNITASQAGNGIYYAAPDVIQGLTVNKNNQTITFGALADRTFGDIPFNLSATASSGLTVTYASSNLSVATVSDNTLTIVGAGTTNITASQTGNGIYYAAPDVIQGLTVNKINQTITFGALADKTFGDIPFNLTATASSGLTVTYESSNLSVATISGNTVTIVGGGTTSVTAKQAGDNSYAAAPDVSQSLLVIKANQLITFNPLSPMAFSDTALILTAVSNSGLPISYSSSNTSVATISGNTTTLTGPGLTNITATQAGNSSFNSAVSVVQSLYVIGLCVVRYDNSEDKNMIVWEKPITNKINAFKIYKEFGSGNYIPVITVPYNKYSAIIDSSSDPDSHADRYKLSVIDSLGKESKKSYFHKTPHIIFVGSNIFLQDNYQDESGLFIPSFFYIYRSTKKTALVLHDSISGTLSTYTDPTFTGGNMFYQVGIKKTPACVPTGILKADIGPYTQSLSNIVEYKGSKLVSDGIIEAEIFPNPANDIVTVITESRGVLSLTDISCRIIKKVNILTNETKLDVSQLPAGCYIISIQTEEGVVTSKLIVE